MKTLLDALSYEKMQSRINFLDEEIKKLTAEKKSLKQYFETKEQYDIIRIRNGKSLATAQDRKALRWMLINPLLALSKGASAVQVAVCRYTDEESEHRFDDHDAYKLNLSGEEKKISEYLQQFCDDKVEEPKEVIEQPKTEEPFDMASVKTRRVGVDAPSVIDYDNEG